jgi:methylmalonyl-CoA mutase C-terminal domain/subunit
VLKVYHYRYRPAIHCSSVTFSFKYTVHCVTLDTDRKIGKKSHFPAIPVRNHSTEYNLDAGDGMDKKIRVLVAKPGLDGHDRGAKIVARALRDAGMEVIYTGLRQTPEMIVEAALEEDVDAIGLSILSGAHMTLVPRVLELLKLNRLGNRPVFVGGIIPDEDAVVLKETGVAGIFGPGTTTTEIINSVRLAVTGAKEG